MIYDIYYMFITNNIKKCYDIKYIQVYIFLYIERLHSTCMVFCCRLSLLR